jgi:single-strand DNA-binding protein
MINRVILGGNLTRDPEVKKTASGLSVTTFSIAVNRRTKDKEEVNYFDCEAWRQTADYVGQYAKKGNTVVVDGKLYIDSYERDGQTIKRPKIVVDSIDIVRSSQGSVQSNPYQPTPAQSAPKASTGYFPDDNPSNDDFNTGPLLDISSDDLPF